MSRLTRIIGIDPGLRRTGWGLIISEGTRLSYVGCGTVEPDAKLELGPRLAWIFEALTKIIRDFEPDEAAVEETFVNKDARATLKLGQARGVAMLAPALAGLTIGEYAPNQVKKTIVGSGHAEKRQIRMMVKVLLPKSEFKSDDAADALAVALCHAQHRGIRAL